MFLYKNQFLLIFSFLSIPIEFQRRRFSGNLPDVQDLFTHFRDFSSQIGSDFGEAETKWSEKASSFAV